MQLLKFSGEGLHDFLDVEVKFNKDLTFLVGINGSGKTTALDAIDALLSPSPASLGRMDFKAIRVDFSNDKKKGFVSAKKEGDFILLSVPGHPSLRFAAYVTDSDISRYRDADHEREYYRDFLTTHGDHPVLGYINNLPTPMFLGLSRRTIGSDLPPLPRAYDQRNLRARKNIFSGSLAQGVVEARVLAESQHRDMLIEVARLGENLRKSMLLELLTVEAREGMGRISMPSEAELKKVVEMRKGMEGIARILGLPFKQVEEKFKGFLDILETTSRRIPKNTTLEKLFEDSGSKHEPTLSAIVTWNVNAPELKRIQRLSDMVETYNKQVQLIQQENNNYLSLLHKFIADSGKEISFDDRGVISINLVNKNYRIPIASLSSGESQIFVILTHLFFNQRVKSDNVFIIDERELSLHIQWQELFVESLFTANPKVQYILATHSPSIILDRVENCVEVSGKAIKKSLVEKEKIEGKMSND